MKNLSYYILAILILCSLNDKAHSVVLDTINKEFGYVSYVAEDLPQDENITEGCKCVNGKITSSDGIFKRDCPCITSGKECKCNHTDKPKPDIGSKESDCDIIKSMGPAYRKFLPKQKGKELWVLKVKSDAQGKNWCLPCKLMENEFSKMKRTGWVIDEDGTLEKPGEFQVRVVDFDHFEELPAYFYEIKKDKEGNIIMNGDKQEANVSLPTVIFWQDCKVKTVHKGFLNSFGLLKLWDGKPVLKGVDDVPTK